MRSAVALWLLMVTAVVSWPPLAAAQSREPQRVTFLSADKRTTLVGYLYRPRGDGPAPAVVMMHGRAGAYSSLARGRYDASTLSMRHKFWGRLWAEEGYVALMVDGFGPRGYAKGFPRFSYDNRPDAVSEVYVRPLDAYGALAYLRTRSDVIPDRIGLQGWSNGASATLATMSVDSAGITRPTPAKGFRGALVFYAACGLQGEFDRDGYLPYSPVLAFHGTGDEEVSWRRCDGLVKRSQRKGGDIQIHIYPGAEHSFDDPGRKRQSLPANRAATRDAEDRAVRFFAEQLNGRQRR